MTGCPPEKLARAKAAAKAANEEARLARAAIGGGTRADQEKAQAALVDRHGRRGAARLVEQEMRKMGARPKGLGRFFG